MGRNDEKHLVLIFTVIVTVLILVIMITIRSQSNISPDVVSNARSQFIQNIPPLMIKSELQLDLVNIYSENNPLPEIVFRTPEHVNSAQFISSIRSLLTSRFEIMSQVARDSMLAFGVGVDGYPVGKLIISGAAREELSGEVGIIIDDFGYYDDEVTEEFLTLSPNNVTFSVIPGHDYSEKIGKDAAGRGFEIMVHMPMEPMEYEGGEGDYILLSGMSSRQVIRRLNNAFEELPMAVGLNNHQGSRATQDPRVMQTVLYMLRSQNMFFIDSYTSPESVGYELARKIGVSSARRTVFLDNEQDSTYIATQMEELVTTARYDGTAIGICHAKELTLAMLKELMPLYESQGIRFTRVSNLVTSGSPVM